MIQPTANEPTHSGSFGLPQWIDRAVQLHSEAKQNLEEETVHVLRTSLRRCLSMTETLVKLDPHKKWKRFQKKGRRLFKGLGGLRDMQVLAGWVRKLAPENDPLTAPLLAELARREQKGKDRAEKAVLEFQPQDWQELGAFLSPRTDRLEIGGLAFQHMATEILERSIALRNKAIATQKMRTWHDLRIEIKRFRYVLENFVPLVHQSIKRDLKKVQDLLGDVHDLDVLWERVRKFTSLSDPSLDTWCETITREREERLNIVTRLTSEPDALLIEWRKALPSGHALEEAAFSTLSAWSSYLTKDIAKAKRRANLSLHLFDGFYKEESTLSGFFPKDRARRLLRGAALMLTVGESKGEDPTQNASARLIRKRKPPLGWTRKDMRLVALIIRKTRVSEHRARKQNPNKSLSQALRTLAGLLHQAHGFCESGALSTTRLSVETMPGGFIIRASGYKPEPHAEERMEKQKSLLEFALRKTILVIPG